MSILVSVRGLPRMKFVAYTKPIQAHRIIIQVLTVFVSFGHGVDKIGEGDVHRWPLGQMTERFRLAWRDRHFD